MINVGKIRAQFPTLHQKVNGKDLVYFDKCQKCEDGMILNPSATKGHKYNGEEEEKV